MFECRKIYANLLLLSVMLFAVCASSQPRIWLENVGGESFRESSQSTFQWDNPGGTIIYRGGKLTAAVGGEMDYLAPEKVVLEIVAGIPEALVPETENGLRQLIWDVLNPRGPPCSTFFIG